MAVSMIPNTKYVTFKLLLHAAFAADEILVLCLKQLVRSRFQVSGTYVYICQNIPIAVGYCMSWDSQVTDREVDWPCPA